MSVNMRQQLRELEVEEVEETGKVLGRGSYGVVVELKIHELRYVYVLAGNIHVVKITSDWATGFNCSPMLGFQAEQLQRPEMRRRNPRLLAYMRQNSLHADREIYLHRK